MTKLRLMASDAQDLAVIAAATQDAIVNVGGIYFDKPARALTLRMTRFRHEAREAKGKGERIEAGLRIDGVLGLQSRNINRDSDESFAVILNIEFDASEDGLSGHINILLAGGGVLRANVEALDVILADTDNARMTKVKPNHDI